MRYHPDSRFKTKHWRELWQSDIRNLIELADADTSGCVFVIADTEEPNEKGKAVACVMEIGLAVLPPFAKRHRNKDKDEEKQDSAAHTELNYTDDGINEQGNAEVHCICIKGAQRRDNSDNRFRYGELQLVESEAVEETLVGLRFDAKPVLVSFCIRRELTFLSTHAPRSMKLFS